MNNEYPATPEEKAYDQLADEQWELLSEVGRTIFGRAEVEAYRLYLCSRYSYQLPWELDKAMDEMHVAAAELTVLDCKLLAPLWRAALAAAASIDPDDRTTLVGDGGVYRGALHRYYRQISSMVERILSEKKMEAKPQRKAAERVPEDFSDIPF